MQNDKPRSIWWGRGYSLPRFALIGAALGVPGTVAAFVVGSIPTMDRYNTDILQYVSSFMYVLVTIPVGMVFGMIVGCLGAIAHALTEGRNSPSFVGILIGGIAFVAQGTLAYIFFSTGIITGISGMGGVALTAPITGAVFGLYAFWRSRYALRITAECPRADSR